MATVLDIDFVSDIACPWCAIGLASLEQALGRTAGTVEARLRCQPFELNPRMPREGERIAALLGSRYGAAQLAQMRETVRARAAAVGFIIDQHADSRTWNTFDGHRLLHWAHDSPSQLALQRALFAANFTHNRDVSDPGVLVAAAIEAGLDGEAAREVLHSGRFAAEVRQQEQAWIARGIQSVPGFVVNGQWLISGGQPPEAFEQALRQIAAQLTGR